MDPAETQVIVEVRSQQVLELLAALVRLPHQNLYDHLLIANPTHTTELVQNATVLDLHPLATENKTFFQTVSDHLSIVARFRVTTDDDQSKILTVYTSSSNALAQPAVPTKI